MRTSKHLACLLALTLVPVFHGENLQCPLRAIIVGFTEPPANLSAADFKASVGGKAVQISSVTSPGGATRVAILVDVSANHDQLTWAATRAMVEEFLAAFPITGDFAMITFDDRVERVALETDRAKAQGALAETFPSGKRESEAGLGAALQKAIESLGAYRLGDSILLVTSSDQISKTTEQLLKQQRIAGTRLFGVSFEQSTRRGTLPFGAATVEDYTPLEGAARASGGTWVRFDRSHEDERAALQSARSDGKSAADVVRNHVAIELQQGARLTKPEKLKIEMLKGPKGKEHVFYPQELFPCE